MKNKNNINFKKYIEYLIFEKKVLNEKNIFIGILMLAIISFFGLFIGTKFNKDKVITDEITLTQMEEVLLSAGYTEQELEAMSTEEKIDMYEYISKNNKNQSTGKNVLGEFSKDKSSSTKMEYYLLASQGNFSQIVKDFNNKKTIYSFTETYNKELITIYNDAYLLDIALSEPKGSYMRKDVLNKIHDPRMLICGILFSEEEDRRDVIKDKFSLSPILNEPNIKINSIKSSSMSNIETNAYMNNDAKVTEIANYIVDGNFFIYKINFTIDGNELIGYIYKDMNTLDLYTYGIYAPPGVDNNYYYINIYDWIRIESNLQNSTPQYANGSSNSNNKDDDYSHDDVVSDNNISNKDDDYSHDDVVPDDVVPDDNNESENSNSNDDFYFDNINDDFYFESIE